MGIKEDKRDKEKTRRVETAKLCYNICHSIITITILGNAAPLFGIGDKNSEASVWLLVAGAITALVFFRIGYITLKK